MDEPDYMMGGILYRGDKERFMQDPELREAFEAGCKHGYHKAHKEMEEYHERRMYGDHDGIIHYRDDRDWDDDYDERRRRSRRTGRYI